ncbi:damage-control phosphatase ARMT1 family protein [Methanoplanus endosymbiosus]|uniref:ARMT1-like domain-containing protein n=1 Tax=Methanoplanus endosymbiosus TaxID=33865 RepID=A0A9E7PSE8_9EURY|nr:ARMT1-like domain-containing protein [Methanoplanus endosymbiosus]UUX92842.1 ARMT1-like domain-containing protein [Methanoplanus endosymbiosus]
MKINNTCFNCLLGRVEYECRLATDDDKLIEETAKKCKDLLIKHLNDDNPSPQISSMIHRLVCECISDSDPYRKIKSEDNKTAGIVLEDVKDNLSDFRDICLGTIIANTLDHGSVEHKVSEDFSAFFMEEFRKGLSIDDTDEASKLCKKIVFLCDNCGEIVFDRHLIKHLKNNGSEITVVVRGLPIINDATMEDALSLGLDKIADRLLTNADDTAELGVNLDLLPQDVNEAIDDATLIISKGMANYESLSEHKKTEKLPPVLYLMMVKCQPIAEDIGISKGSRIAMLVR